MTRAVVTTPRALHAYLRRATWGLPRARQQELWDELEEHVLTRAEQLQCSGASPQAALSQALAELGSPGRVALGMTQVYAMPKLLIAAGTVALGISAALFSLAGGSGAVLNLPVLTSAPVKPSCVRGTAPTSDRITIVSRKDGVTCYTFKDPRVYEGAYLSLSGVRQAVAGTGGRVESQPDGRIKLVLDRSQIRFPPSFTRDGERYFLAAALASTLYNERVEQVQLQGYERPSLRFNNLTLNFGDGTQAGFGKAFYRGLALELLGYILFDARTDGTLSYSISTVVPGGSEEHRVQTGLKPGEVVLLATKRAGSNYDLDTAPVQADGTAVLSIAPTKLRFVSDPAQLGPYPSGGRINALLVRVSNIPLNQLRQGIFVPAQATSDAR